MIFEKSKRHLLIIGCKILFLLISFFHQVSSEGKFLSPENLKLHCNRDFFCEKYQQKFNEILETTKKYEEFKERIRFHLKDDIIEKFSMTYKLINEIKEVDIYISFKFPIHKIEFIHNKNLYITSQRMFFPYRVRTYFDPFLKEKAISVLDDFLTEKGFLNNQIEMKVINENDLLALRFVINTEKIVKVKAIEVFVEDDFWKDKIERSLYHFKDSIFDKTETKIAIDRISKEILENSHFNAKIDFNSKYDLKRQGFLLSVKLDLGNRHEFYFDGNTIFENIYLRKFLKNFVKNNLGTLNKKALINVLNKEYENVGIYKSKVEVQIYKNLASDKKTYLFKYFFNIKEGRKIKINKLDFSGSYKLGKEEILKIYKEKGSDLSRGGFLDIDYLREFSKILRTEYLKNGLAFIKIVGPKITINEENFECDVDFTIREGQLTLVENISFGNEVTSELSEKIKSKLKNQIYTPLNLTALEKDLGEVISVLQGEGYYFAKIRNKDKKIVFYENNYTSAEIKIDIDLGKMAYLNEVLVTGNLETETEVVKREVVFEKGDIIVPSKILEIKNSLLLLGIFSVVDIETYTDSTDNKKVFLNILIRVKEKDFGLFEIAPGYRTELGAKLSLKVSYNNISGKNRSATLEVQGNKRPKIEGVGADDMDKNPIWEYLFKASVSDPYFLPSFFGKKTEFSLLNSLQRKKYLPFNADIWRLSPRLSRSFGDHFTASIKYQFEYISQFDSIAEEQDGSFRIGGFTTLLSLSFLDRVTNPRKGYYGSLSFEINTPELFSVKDDFQEVNFLKVVTRNKIYFPLGPFTFASSLSLGLEKNLAGLDYRGEKFRIPGIKIFRLDGVDTIRGFSDSEINLLGGKDVSESDINEYIYFSAMKFELRYLISDAFVLATFFDAGRLFLEKISPFNLRSSVGISMKMVTPIGTLDLDFGVKTKRYPLPSGETESFGKLHLLVGQF